MSTTIDLAPDPVVVAGLTVVPVDITHVTATLVLDAATSTATGDATVDFVVGPHDGCPFFDLRQSITACWLDGVPVPPADVAHHAFPGAEPGAELRVLARALVAGSTHQLRVQYGVGQPIGSPVVPQWSGGGVVFRFGFSDLTPARYLEQWLPANLVYDQLAVSLEVEVRNSSVAHAVITNGSVSPLGGNHWSIAFPARFTALSHLLEIRPADTVVSAAGSVTLPVSGTTVTIEAHRLVSTNVDLMAAISTIGGMLADNENSYGAYRHGSRFVVLFSGGGMEYDGGTTTGVGALGHEVFHSWFARGVKPAAQSDGWWDEAITVWHDGGASSAVPLDFTAPPVTLASRQPWTRTTAGAAYSAGTDLIEGLAAEVGVTALRNALRAFHDDYGDRPATTADLETLLVARTGRPAVVDAFHRFAFGLSDSPTLPDLWLRDDTLHAGDESWSGQFWNSPDVWVRHQRDGGTAHQQPLAGQDNWFYARVRNRGAAAAHLVVTFAATSFAGMEFSYPADFLPATAAAAVFDLPAGGERVVSTRWPAADVPAAGAHHCILVAALARGTRPGSNRHVWEDNSLAQRNVTVVSAPSGNTVLLPFAIAAAAGLKRERLLLETLAARPVEATLLVPHRPEPLLPRQLPPAPLPPYRHFAGARRLPMEKDGHVALTVHRGAPRYLAVELAVPQDASPGEVLEVDVVKRRPRDGRVTGGISAQITVTEPQRGADRWLSPVGGRAAVSAAGRDPV